VQESHHRGNRRYRNHRSEETGGISLAVAGTMERDLTVERLAIA